MEKSNTYKIIRRFVDNTMNADLVHQIKIWLVSNRHEAAAEEALQHIWDETETEPDASTWKSMAQTEQKIWASTSRHRHPQLLQTALKYAALLLLPLLTAAGTYLYMQSTEDVPEMIECFVANGEQRHILLPDNSEVKINAGSLLIYPKYFDGSTRTIYLSGEANFAVAKDKKPFIVKTGRIDIQALGTKFNVQAYSESGKTITTLENGIVKVFKPDSAGCELLLAPNEQAIYNHQSGNLDKHTIVSADYSAWTKGELCFTNLSLNKIFTLLERHFDVQIQINARIVNQDYYTMKFLGGESIDQIMDVLTKTVGNISYRHQEKIIQIYPLEERKGGVQ